MKDLEKTAKLYRGNASTGAKLVMLENSASAEFKRIFVYIQPLFATGGSGEHFRINMRRKTSPPNAAQDRANIFASTAPGTTLEVSEVTPKGSMLRYMLGLPAADGSGTAKTTLAAADLSFLAGWVKAKVGGTSNWTVNVL
jgi:hypothetical protein